VCSLSSAPPSPPFCCNLLLVEDKDLNWVGLEIRFERVYEMWGRGVFANVDNLLSLHGDARVLLQQSVQPASVMEVEREVETERARESVRERERERERDEKKERFQRCSLIFLSLQSGNKAVFVC